MMLPYYQWEISRILKWRYCTICLAIFCGDIPLHRPYIGLIYGRYLQFRILEFPLILDLDGAISFIIEVSVFAKKDLARIQHMCS